MPRARWRSPADRAREAAALSTRWRAAAKDQARTNVGLVPFVGAGLSRRFGFPLWAEFLRSNAKLAEVAAEVEKRLNAGDYEGAAEVILQRREELFQLEIRHTFGREVTTPTGPVAILPRLSKGYVLTTNFDRVLEAAFVTAGNPFEAVITGSRTDSITDAITKNLRCLVKLHGDALERSDRILTAMEYEQYYGKGKPGNPLLLDIFRHPMIFVGCSLLSDRPVMALKQLHRESSRTMHYAILELPEHEDTTMDRERELAECNIVPIWFPHGAFDTIEEILEFLAEAAGPSTGAQGPGEREWRTGRD